MVTEKEIQEALANLFEDEAVEAPVKKSHVKKFLVNTILCDDSGRTREIVDNRKFEDIDSAKRYATRKLERYGDKNYISTIYTLNKTGEVADAVMQVYLKDSKVGYERLDESVQLNEMKISVDNFNSYSIMLNRLADEYKAEPSKDIKQFIIDKLHNVNFVEKMDGKQRQFITDFISKVKDENYTPDINTVLGNSKHEEKAKKPTKEKSSEKFYSYGKTIAPMTDIKKAQREKTELLKMKAQALRNQNVREGVENSSDDKVTVEFVLPGFYGYYGSSYEMLIRNRDDENINEIGKKYVEIFKEHVGEVEGIVDMEYQYTWSPRYYNYESDEIVVSATIFRSALLQTVENISNLEKQLSELNASRDGYVSFMPTAVQDFKNIIKFGDAKELEPAVTEVLEMVTDQRTIHNINEETFVWGVENLSYDEDDAEDMDESAKPLSEEYMSDEDIAKQYSDFEVINIDRRPSGQSGWIEISFPNADDIDFDSSMITGFIIYDNGKVAFDDWFPNEVAEKLAKIVKEECSKPLNEDTLRDIVHPVQAVSIDAIDRIIKKYGYDITDVIDISEQDGKHEYNCMLEIYPDSEHYGKKNLDKDTSTLEKILKSKLETNNIKVKHAHDSNGLNVYFYYSESLDEDTEKQNGKWVNKGKEGAHGIFKTKKEADAQRKAMFANGYKAESLNEASDDYKAKFMDTYKDEYKRLYNDKSARNSKEYELALDKFDEMLADGNPFIREMAAYRGDAFSSDTEAVAFINTYNRLKFKLREDENEEDNIDSIIDDWTKDLKECFKH